MGSDKLTQRHQPSMAATLAQIMRGGGGPVPARPVVDLLVDGGVAEHRIGGVSPAELDDKLAKMRAWVTWASDRSEGNAVLVDTTLVATVTALTLGEQPDRSLTAPTLLDLATFARAVVFYDRVFVLPGARAAAEAINAALGEPVVIPLTIPYELDDGNALYGFGAVLGNLFESARMELSAVRSALPGAALADDLRALAQGWGVLLGRRVSAGEVLLDEMSEWHNWDSNGPGLLARIVAAEGSGGGGHHDTVELFARYPALARRLYGSEDLTELLSECNHRAYFQLRLSYLLRLPYLGSASRLPFRGHLYRHAAFAHHRLLLHAEAERLADRSRYHVPERLDLPMPVLASIALRQASTPAGILTELAHLRHRSAALRRHRAEYERALHDGDNSVLERLRGAVANDAAGLVRTLAAPVALTAAGTLAAAASPTTGLTLALIGVLGGIGNLAADHREALLRRLLHPAAWFLTSTAQTARGIGSNRRDIVRLWQLGDADADWLGGRLAEFDGIGPA